MNDHDKSRDELIEEIRLLRERLALREAPAGPAPCANEDSFRQLAENIQDVLWISDPRKPQVFYVSPAYEKIWGMRCADLYADPFHWIRAIHPDDRERVASTFLQKNLQGNYDEEYRIVRPDGTVRWIRDRGVPIRNAAGEVCRVAGTATDVTARKRAEEELRRSEERFAKAFRANPVAIAISTVEEGRFVDVNDSFLELFGYTRPEVVGHTTRELRTWVGALERERVVDHLRARGAVRSREVRFRTKAGAVRDCLLSIELIELHGEPRLLGFVHDITERKRMEADLRDSEERLRRFFEAAFEGLAFHEDGVIVDANRSLAELFGYEPGELIGRHAVDLAAPASREVVRSHIVAGDERPYEALGLRKDGSTFYGEVCGKPVSYHGRTARVTAVRDISARKCAERKLHEYARRLQALSRRLLEVQEQERRHLARELHDEVGQALTGLNLTLETGARLPDDGLRQTLREAQQAVRDLTGKVRDLSLRLRPSMLDDLGLVPALLWHLERYTAQTHVQVEFEHAGVEPRLSPEVETAAYRIVQEGLTNVARHAGVPRCAVRVWLAGGTLHVLVDDPGKGFDGEAALARGESSGLSGMRERAELLGGRLTVQSSPGQGTRLTAELPVPDGDV